MEARNTCAVVTFNDGSKRHYTNVLRGGLSMSSRGAHIALTMLDHSVQHLEGSNSVMMVDDHWLRDHVDLISSEPHVGEQGEYKPTPGPWWVDATGTVVAGDPNHYRVIADTRSVHIPETQRIANAEVMAHALQMRSLLERIVARYREDHSLHECLSSDLLSQSERLIEDLETREKMGI